MQFYYGNQMPLRLLDEAEFWKHQEEEHTVVIRELVKDLEPEYVEALHKWERKFAKTHRCVLRYIETVNRSPGECSPQLIHDIHQLIAYCLDESERFIRFCEKLLKKSEPIKSNPTAITVMKHIIRESEYFVGIAQTILYNK